jgi:hypothetical protein
MTRPSAFPPANTFRVVCSTPMYHHSTDGYIGNRDIVIALCGTLEAAFNVAAKENDPYEDPADPYHYIVLPNGNIMNYTDWVPLSHYSGPPGPDYPF